MIRPNDGDGSVGHESIVNLMGGAVAYNAGNGLLSGEPVLRVDAADTAPRSAGSAFVRYFGGRANAIIIAALGSSLGAGIVAGVVAYTQMR